MTGVQDLARLDGQLKEIADAADILSSVVDRVQSMSEALDVWDVRHSVTVYGNGLDAVIDISIDLTSRAPRVRDVLVPVPTAEVVPIATSDMVLARMRAEHEARHSSTPRFNALVDSIDAVSPAFMDEVMRQAGAQIVDHAIDAALAEPSLIDADNAIPVPPLSDDWDETDPVRVPAEDGVREAATPAETTAGGNEAHAAAEEAVTSSATAPVDPYAGMIPASHPLTDEDRATILRMWDANETQGAIAKALNRDPRGFYHQVKRVLNARSEELRAQLQREATSAPAMQTVHEFAPTDQPTANAVDAPPLGATLSGAEHARLDRLRPWGGWTAKMDLALVAGLTRGSKLAEVALDIGFDAAACKKRYAELVPDRTVEQQAAVLKALTERAAAATRRVA
jgi:hypothetical protein